MSEVLRDNRYDQIFNTLEASTYGQELAQRTRFNDFKPEFVTTDQWCALLGDDVNNLYHMSHTKGLAKRFSELSGLSDESTDLLLTTAITHDIGEAIIGDIPLPSKTAEDETKERIAYRQIATELWGDNGLTERVWSVLGHEDEEHADMFRAVGVYRLLHNRYASRLRRHKSSPRVYQARHPPSAKRTINGRTLRFE